jgi:hypothetical protein
VVEDCLSAILTSPAHLQLTWHSSLGRPVTTQPTRRRWFQFGLGTLFLALTVVAVCAGLLANRADRQRAAIKRVLERGGNVWYDYQVVSAQKEPGRFIADAKSPYPDRLVRAVGIDYFHGLTMVALQGPTVTDENLRLLGKVPCVEYLDLAGANISNEGLRYLRELKNLRFLNVEHARIDDRGLEQLACHTGLTSLILDDTDITDSGLAHLGGMTELEHWFGLQRTHLTDAGVKQLEGFKKLRRIALNGTQITEEGLNRLRAAFPNTEVNGDQK